MTDDVMNQPPPLTGGNAWRGDPLLIQLAERFSDPVRKDLDGLGRFVLTQEAQELARLANVETPKLRTHDRQGRRIDVVEFHPAYHALMRRSVANGLHSSVWENGDTEIGRRHQVRAARFYLTAELETGHLCPITMTNASLAALMASPKLFREWAPRVTTRKYDQSQKPPVEKTGLTLGMGMTEKQGGTDVRANVTRAERAGSGFYRLTGHKWFMSAPMSDAFLVLAQAPEGLSCFLVPRVLGDGSGNGFRFQRLKDKLGNRSNASSEVEFVNAIGEMVGEPGAGVKTIMDMVTLTRLDCAIASSAIMRAGLAEAVHHARHRQVFGSTLIEQPLMQRVLADMALDVAAATALSFRLARSFDEAASDRGEAAFARAMTPVVKYWVCKIAPPLLYEAMECLGGNGYVEEAPLARYYREAPVNAIWEGSGNVMALDVLRVLGRAPGLFEDVLAGIDRDLGAGGRGTIGVLKAAMQVASTDEGSARLLTEQLALSAAAAELRRLGAGRIAAAFVETR
ncbi:DNA alkylation response protein, partial [Mesorhizobium sp. M7A.T.Ca.US.000.02.2.1]